MKAFKCPALVNIRSKKRNKRLCVIIAIMFIAVFPASVWADGAQKSSVKYAIPAIEESVLNQYINKVMQALGTDSSNTKAEANLSLKIEKNSKTFSAVFEILPPDSSGDFCDSQVCCKWTKTPADKNQASWKASSCKKIMAVKIPWKWISIKQQVISNEQQTGIVPTEDNSDIINGTASKVSDSLPDSPKPSSDNYRSLKATDRPFGHKEAIIAAIILLPVFLGMLVWFKRKGKNW